MAFIPVSIEPTCELKTMDMEGKRKPGKIFNGSILSFCRVVIVKVGVRNSIGNG
jgi:hypothetical protein